MQSKDEIDVLFMAPNEQLALEIKSVRSNELDLKRGIFQCVKYRAVLEAEATWAGAKQNVRVRLVSERPLPPEFARQANRLKVEVQIITPLG